MKLNMRAYDAPDFWKIRAFLRETFLLNDREELNWQAYRFEYWVWHGVANLDQGPMEEKVLLWETPEGDLAAVLNAEGKGNAFLQVHPEFRSEQLEKEMVDVAEERLWTVAKDGRAMRCARGSSRAAGLNPGTRSTRATCRSRERSPSRWCPRGSSSAR
jgi:GNAT superfamily N-acetyltransferase